jgi:uncharacterized membrane protein YqhA
MPLILYFSLVFILIVYVPQIKTLGSEGNFIVGYEFVWRVVDKIDFLMIGFEILAVSIIFAAIFISKYEPESKALNSERIDISDYDENIWGSDGKFKAYSIVVDESRDHFFRVFQRSNNDSVYEVRHYHKRKKDETYLGNVKRYLVEDDLVNKSLFEKLDELNIRREFLSFRKINPKFKKI